MIKSWKKFISSLFDYCFNAENCAESDEKVIVLINQIFAELNQASTKSPSCQMNALVGLGILLSELGISVCSNKSANISRFRKGSIKKLNWNIFEKTESSLSSKNVWRIANCGAVYYTRSSNLH